MTVATGVEYKDILTSMNTVTNKTNIYKVTFKPTEDDHKKPITPVLTYEICGLLSNVQSYCVKNGEIVRQVSDMVLCDHKNNDCSECKLVMAHAMFMNIDAMYAYSQRHRINY